jgi:hypothetical protein
MTHALSFCASALASIAATLLPAKAVSQDKATPCVPTNTPIQAFAGDMIRTGVQLRIAQKEKERLSQAEFPFVIA